MKRTLFFATLLLSAIALLTTSCGTGDKINSVSMTVAGQTGTVNLVGLGGTLQLQVLANYTSGKFIDETQFATYKMEAIGFEWDNSTPMPAPPLGAAIDPSGMVTATEPGVCSWWSNTGTTGNTGWSFRGYYKVTATYRGFTSNPVFIPVASAASGQTGVSGQCGPA